MQTTSNTKAFIHKEQYGGKKKMQKRKKQAVTKTNQKAKPNKTNPKAMPKARPMAKPKKQGY